MKYSFFLVIRSEAGKAELALTITSPSGRNVPYECTPIPNQGEHVTYIPQEPGPHHIYITYGGLEVPGEFFTTLYLFYVLTCAWKWLATCFFRCNVYH